MKLDPAGCEWYKLEITTDPATIPTDWEASIDGGTTYETAVDVGGDPAWLTAGPDYVPGPTPTFVVTASRTHVKVRLIDNPETVIRSSAPAINLT